MVERVVIESPFKGETKAQEAYHKAYLQACLRDSILNHGEAPFASHQLYTEALDDGDAREREIGISIGLEFAKACTRSVFYVDLGMSEGMQRYAWPAAEGAGREIVIRRLGGVWSAKHYLNLIAKDESYENWLTTPYDGGAGGI
jgi:hypothetical protein